MGEGEDGTTVEGYITIENLFCQGSTPGVELLALLLHAKGTQFESSPAWSWSCSVFLFILSFYPFLTVFHKEAGVGIKIPDSQIENNNNSRVHTTFRNGPINVLFLKSIHSVNLFDFFSFLIAGLISWELMT